MHNSEGLGLSQECTIFVVLIMLKIAHHLWLKLAQEFTKFTGLI